MQLSDRTARESYGKHAIGDWRISKATPSPGNNMMVKCRIDTTPEP
jgi:hypothetical protein